MPNLLPIADVGMLTWIPSVGNQAFPILAGSIAGASVYSPVTDTATGVWDPSASTSLTVRLAATPAPGIQTGHRVSFDLYLSGGYAATVTIKVIDGNTLTVLSTSPPIALQNYVDAVYTYNLPAADVANFLTTSYNNIQVTVTRNPTVGSVIVQLNSATWTVPPPEVSQSLTDTFSFTALTVGGRELAASILDSFNWSDGSDYGSVDNSVLGYLLSPATAIFAANAAPGLETTAAASDSMAFSEVIGRLVPAVVSRRDLVFSAPLGKPQARRDR